MTTARSDTTTSIVSRPRRRTASLMLAWRYVTRRPEGRRCGGRWRQRRSRRWRRGRPR
jgi:hypothetical protein